MELRDARKINSKELYDRRKQAVLLFEKGLKRYEIAPLVGVSAYTVGQWIKSLSTNKLILIAPCAILSSRKNNGGKHGNDKAENMGNNG